MSNTTLLIIDVQTALVEALSKTRQTELLDRITNVREKARKSGVPVVYVQHQDEELGPNTAGWQIASQIVPADSEPVVAKTQSDSFEGTNLEELLKRRNADHVILCGMQTEFCVNATLHGAQRRGYRVTLISDAHATFDTPTASEEQIRERVHKGAQGVAEVIPSTGLAL